MKVLVINGSPKGKYSSTLQTSKYLEKHNKQDIFEYIEVVSQLKKFEKDFSEIKIKLQNADLVIFSYPVYTFLVPSQLHRFIELMIQNKVDCKGIFATQISTSKHFYDITAAEFIKENCIDFGFVYLDGLLADMEDLLKSNGRKQALDFFRYCKFQIGYQKKVNSTNNSHDEIKKTDKNRFRLTIITNAKSEDHELLNRIEYVKNQFPYSSNVFNITEFGLKGGCLGCLKCATSGNCIYKDGFQQVLREQIQTSSCIIYAFTIKEHSMGADFKQFDDRQFCNGHRTLTIGMPIGYLINGNYNDEKNLQMVIKARASVAQNIIAKISTSANQDIELIDKLSYLLENPISKPQNFYGIGGTKIFRDLIYLMGGFMKADYQFYKKQGFFSDFPQNSKSVRLKMKLVGLLLSNKKISSKIGNKINEEMIKPYQKIMDK